jgi:hypothetical protein
MTGLWVRRNENAPRVLGAPSSSSQSSSSVVLRCLFIDSDDLTGGELIQQAISQCLIIL